ncbi:MAG: type I-E CRISPR-associated protein Cse2/CasB [Dehalococcoidia bacterium]|nr:type I-E CRISPR-associated protein Cse2/CasB [Dehalococcoidia bacterium]
MAVEFAGLIGSARFSRGDLAALRRMNPDSPDASAFWRLMAEQDLLGSPSIESRWALILHGIALMTPTSATGGGSGTAHDGLNPVGRALYLGGDSHRTSAVYAEARLNRLLTARGSMLTALLARMFRMLGSNRVSFNWREMAQFILSADHDEVRAEQGRRRIARAYYEAERRSSPADDEGQG